MTKVLVTGGAGFIGAHLVRALVSQAAVVRVLDSFITGTIDNLAYAFSEEPERLRRLLDGQRRRVQVNDRCEILRGDIRDEAAAASACEGIEVVYHQAALRAVPRSLKDPMATHEVNATGTLRLLEAARAHGVRRVVYASSSSVYGDTPLPKHEGQALQPRSPYAASKLAGEAYSQAYTQAFGLETVSLRYFNVFGPRQDPASEYAAVIPKFIRLALQGDVLPVEGDGRQSRDFTYVDNVVDANLRAAEVRLDGPAVLNVGSGTRQTVLDLVAQIEAILGRPVEVRHVAARVGDVRDSQADIRAAERAIGYRPGVDFASGLRRTVEAMRGEGALAREGA